MRVLHKVLDEVLDIGLTTILLTFFMYDLHDPQCQGPNSTLKQPIWQTPQLWTVQELVKREPKNHFYMHTIYQRQLQASEACHEMGKPDKAEQRCWNFPQSDKPHEQAATKLDISGNDK